MAKCGKQEKFTITTRPEVKLALDAEAKRARQKTVDLIREGIDLLFEKRGIVVGDNSSKK